MQQPRLWGSPPFHGTQHGEGILLNVRKKTTNNISKVHRLKIQNFAHLANVELSLGDLTVVVGPQGVGKSLALQWLKIALDGRQVTDQLRAAGHPTDRADVLVDLIFGTGMASAWTPSSSISFDGSKISLKNIPRRGSGEEKLFFVPAHRSMLISDGWASPFQKLNSDTPAVARLFSQNLFDRFSDKDAGNLFPINKRLKEEIRTKIDEAVFHGGKADHPSVLS
ncbi:MAG: hypothetical protein NTY94_09450 [Alphaproteobacteria bacterium]|nr:hypothetical protein [Alphaproteobacteria bacterium]